MSREFSVIIEKDEDGWFVAHVPELRGCHTQAKSLDKLMARVKEVIEAFGGTLQMTDGMCSIEAPTLFAIVTDCTNRLVRRS